MSRTYLAESTSLAAFAALIVIGVGAGAAGPNGDPRCEGLSGAAYGMCSAAIALGCDDPETVGPGCEQVENNFTNITGETPPWTEVVCSGNADCASDEYCETPIGRCSDDGVCAERPTSETCANMGPDVVCGCDGLSAENACVAAWLSGVGVLHTGFCK
jgi:hypothetical protein